MAPPQDSAHVALPAAPVRAEQLFGGRYQAVRILKESDGTQTLLANDLEHNKSVVIKTAPERDRFRRARACGWNRNVANCASCTAWTSPRCSDIGTEGNYLYLVMPYVEGVSLEARLRSGPIQVRETLSIGICVFHALRELHIRRVLHRNIKPGNVIIDDRFSVMRAKLVDIGLAHTMLDQRASRPPSHADRAVHIARASGIHGCRCGRAFGPVFRRHFAVRVPGGSPPFSGQTVGKILFEHMTAPVPELSTHGIEVPRALEEVIQHLLRKDPRDRYQSADGVLADLQGILAGLQRGEHDPRVVVGGSDIRSSLTEPALVARARSCSRPTCASSA